MGRPAWKAQIEKILALYARGMTTRDIQAQLQELYGVEVSPTLMRNSLRYVSYKHMKASAATDLKAIYSAGTESEAEFNLELKAREMGCALPQYQQGLANALDSRDPLICFPSGHWASVIYTTNATPSVNMTLRKVTRNHRIFPSDEAVYKVVYLAMRNIAVARGRCRSTTGNRHSIALRWNLGSASPMMSNESHTILDRLIPAEHVGHPMKAKNYFHFSKGRKNRCVVYHSHIWRISYEQSHYIRAAADLRECSARAADNRDQPGSHVL